MRDIARSNQPSDRPHTLLYLLALRNGHSTTNGSEVRTLHEMFRFPAQTGQEEEIPHYVTTDPTIVRQCPFPVFGQFSLAESEIWNHKQTKKDPCKDEDRSVARNLHLRHMQRNGTLLHPSSWSSGLELEPLWNPFLADHNAWLICAGCQGRLSSFVNCRC